GLEVMNSTVQASGQTAGHPGAPAGRRPRRLFLLALWAGLGAGPLPGPARAGPDGGDLSARAALQHADGLYRREQPLGASRAYRQVLGRVSGADRERCFERLLAIYASSGRQDQAVQVGLLYQRWLRDGGEEGRARDLALDIGGWYLDLGHYADAAPALRRALK